MGVTFNILVLLFMALVLFFIRTLLDVLPNIFRCLTFWRENIYIEDNLSITRVRNYFAIVASGILGLILLRYDAMLPRFIKDAGTELRPVITLGYIGVFYLLRFISFRLTFGQLESRSVFTAAHRAILNYVIIAAIIILASVWVMSFFGASDSAIRGVFLTEIAGAFLLLFVRETQILLSRCNGFTTFLYLCTLEILPAGIMVAAAMLL